MATQKLTARDLMHEGCDCIDGDSTIRAAALTMRDEGVGALPICSSDDRLIGMLTDRDIVVKCLAEGLDPDACTAAQLADGRVIWVYDDMSQDEVLGAMEEHMVRRLVVLDRDKKLCGIISQGDIARHSGERTTGELVGVVSQGPPIQHAV